jgi:hypothetical protein
MEVPGFPGYYADRDGNIYSRWTPQGTLGNTYRKRKPTRATNGYLLVAVRVERRTYFNTCVHRLVCAAFHGEPPSENHTCSHINGIRDDNRPENLTWETYSENLKRKVAHGTHDRGYQNSRARIDRATLVQIRQMIHDGVLMHREIGARFGLSRLFITKIANGHRYRGLDELSDGAAVKP